MRAEKPSATPWRWSASCRKSYAASYRASRWSLYGCTWSPTPMAPVRSSLQRFPTLAYVHPRNWRRISIAVSRWNRRGRLWTAGKGGGGARGGAGGGGGGAGGAGEGRRHDGRVKLRTTCPHQVRDPGENAILYRQRQESLRSYVSQVTQAQEEERLRIARELHDDTAQELVRLVRKLGQLRRPSPPDMTQPIDDLLNLTRDILHAVRRYSRDLP